MFEIREVNKKDLCYYWDLHWKYLNEDIFSKSTLAGEFSKEDREYFRSDEYRKFLEREMENNLDKAHFLNFYKEDRFIGCAHYITYKSEDFQCLLLDFWIFEEYRNKNYGIKFFLLLNDYVKKDGAKYFKINISNENNKRFWERQGFEFKGLDEDESPVMLIANL